MNLDELKIKVSIELDDLNKQLKNITKSIDKTFGPKTTKKLMDNNNKVIKSGLTAINKTTINLVRNSRKDITKEIDGMSKDINKSLNKALDVDFRKFNTSLNSAMNQARRTVKSACNDIRRELNNALNINGTISVTGKASLTGSATSKADPTAASNMASSQYIGAMIIKAANAILKAIGDITIQIKLELGKSTDRIVSAIENINKNINKAQKQNNQNKNKTQNQNNKQKANASNNANNQSQNKQKANTSNNNANNQNNRQANPLSSQANVNNTKPSVNKTSTTMHGIVIDIDEEDVPTKAFEQLQNIIEIINYEIKDTEVILADVESKVLSIVKTLKGLKPSTKGAETLTGEVVDDNRLNPISLPNPKSEPIEITDFKVIDDELEEQINEAVSKIKQVSLPTDVFDFDADEAQKQLDEVNEKLDEVSENIAEVMEAMKLINFPEFELAYGSIDNLINAVTESIKTLTSELEKLNELKITIDTSDTEKRLKSLLDVSETIRESLISGDYIKDDIPTSQGERKYPPKAPGQRGSKDTKEPKGKPPKPTIMGFGFGAYKNEIDMLIEYAKKAGSKIKKALSSAFNNIKTGKLHNNMSNAFNKAKSAVSKFSSKVKPILSNAFNSIKTGKLHANVSNALNKAKSAVSKFASKVKSTLSNAFNSIKSTKLYSSVSSALNKAKSAVSKFAAKVGPILNKAFSKINVSKIASGIGKGLNSAKKALSKFASGCKSLWGKIKQIFSKGASDASKATGKLKTGLKDLLKQALGFFSLYSLFNLGKQAIEQSKMLAQAEVKLASLMKQRMGATNDTVLAIRQLAEEQAKLGVVSETAMKHGAQQLAMYVHSAKALETLMPSIANLTAKRGGVFATEDDAEEVATQLGEAIREGTTTPLEQSGIYLSEAEIQKFAQLRTEEERAAYLADVIAKNVGNINQALANTPHGAIAQLKNNFQSLLGTLGIFLANVIKPIVQWLNGIVVACNNALKALGKLLGFDMTGGAASVGDIGTGGSTGGSTAIDTGGIDNTKDAYNDAKKAADEATEANEKFKGSLMGFDEINTLSDKTSSSSGSGSDDEYDPTDITPGAGGQLIPEASVGELKEADSIFSKFADKMKAFISEVLEPFKAAWDLLGDRWKAAWADLVDSFKNFCDSLATFLKSVWEHGGKEFVQHMAEIALAVGIAAMEIGGTILDALAELWRHLDPETNMNTQGLLDAFNNMLPKLRDLILSLNGHLENLLEYGGQDLLNAMGDCFMNLGEAAVRGIGVAIDAIDGLLNHLDASTNVNTQNALKAWTDAFHAIGQAALDLASLLESALVNGGQDMINAFGDMLMKLDQAAGEVTTSIAESFSALFKYLDPATNETTRSMMKSWEDAFNAIGDCALEFAELLDSVLVNGGQDVINALADAFNSLVGLVGDIVKEIADALTGLFEHLNPKTNQFTKDFLKAWENAFNEIKKLFDSMSDYISSVMDNGGQELLNSLGDLGMKIGEAVGVIVEEFAKAWSELLDHMDPSKNPRTKKMLESLDGLVDSITKFVDSCIKAFKKFMDSGGREFINNLGDILAVVIDLAATLAGGIIDLVTAFIDSFAGQALIEGVAKALEWVSEKILALEDVIERIKAIFQDVIDIIVGILEGDGEKVGRAFANLIKNAFKLTQDIMDWLIDIGVDLIEGLIEGLKKTPEIIWNAIVFVYDTIVGFFKELFGIHSPSTVFADLGVNLIEGLAQGISDTISAVLDVLTELKDKALEKIKEMVDKAKEKYEELKNNISEKLQKIKEDASEKWTEIKDNTIEKCKDTYEKAKEKYEEIRTTVSDKLQKIKEDSSEKWNNIKEDASEKITKLKEDAETKYNKMKETLTTTMEDWRKNSEEKWSKVKEKTQEITENLKTTVEEKYSKFKENLTTTMENWRTTSEDKWNKIKEKTGSLVEDLKKNAEEKYNTLKTNLTTTMENWRSTSEEKWNKVKEKTGSLIEDIRTSAEKTYSTLKTNLGNKIQEIKSDAETKWNEVKTKTNNKVSEVVKEATTKYSELKGNFTKKMDEVKTALGPKWDELKNNAKTSAEDMVKKAKDGLKDLPETMAGKMEDALDSMKRKIKSLGNIFSSIGDAWKLPKIKVDGEWSLNPLKVPKFSLQWNARGGIIDGMTPLGFANGALQMGGEAGKEMIVPLENTSFTSKIAQAMGQAVDNAMARNTNYGSAYNTTNDNRDIVLQINDREFARASINSINKLQRESGRTLLDI